VTRARALSPGGGAWLTPTDVERAVRHAAARLPEGAPAPSLTADPVATLVHLLASRDRGITPVVAWPGVEAAALSRLASAVGEAAGRLGVEPGDLLALSTSGSTGAPRTVLRTIASWESSLGPFTEVSGTNPDDVAWAPGPPSSTLTLWALWHALTTGVPVVAGGVWRGVPAWPVLDEVTVLHAVPAVLADVLGARATGRLPALRAAVVAGAALPPALRRRCGELGVRLVEYYGAAELSFVAADGSGTGLRPFPAAEVRVRDDLVEVRSPYLARGYVASSGPFRVDGDGWGGVGDRGVLTPGGVLVVAGRGDDALSVGGSVVLLADVEQVLGGVEGVLEVVCWGEPDARLGQRPRAVLRTDRPDGQRAALVAQVRRAARRELPPAARPLRYAVVDELPRTAAGKPDRRATAALAERSVASQVPRSQW
jgi:long-chain acyl-CoA synthetase